MLPCVERSFDNWQPLTSTADDRVERSANSSQRHRRLPWKQGDEYGRRLSWDVQGQDRNDRARMRALPFSYFGKTTNHEFASFSRTKVQAFRWASRPSTIGLLASTIVLAITNGVGDAPNKGSGASSAGGANFLESRMKRRTSARERSLLSRTIFASISR